MEHRHTFLDDHADLRTGTIGNAFHSFDFFRFKDKKVSGCFLYFFVVKHNERIFRNKVVSLICLGDFNIFLRITHETLSFFGHIRLVGISDKVKSPGIETGDGDPDECPILVLRELHHADFYFTGVIAGVNQIEDRNTVYLFQIDPLGA